MNALILEKIRIVVSYLHKVGDKPFKYIKHKTVFHCFHQNMSTYCVEGITG